jgi:hypothetical protein
VIAEKLKTWVGKHEGISLAAIAEDNKKLQKSDEGFGLFQPAAMSKFKD